MFGHNIQALLIMDKGGIPQFFMKLDPRAVDLNPMLVSGFFTAIRSFSREVIEKGPSEFQVDYGARLFTIISSEELELIAVSVGRWREHFTPLLTDLLLDFEKLWKRLPQAARDKLDINSGFEEFREEVVKRLSLRMLSNRWVPFQVTTDGTLESESVLEPYMNGSRSIEEIVQQCGMREEEVLDEIARLYARGLVDFRRTTDRSDIVVTTSDMDLLMQTTSPRRAELVRSRPDIITMLPRLTVMFDGRKTVGQIAQALSDQFAEEDVVKAIDHLLEMGAVEVLSSEKRRILLVKEAVDLAVRVAAHTYTKDDASRALESALNKIAVPEVVGEFRLSDDGWYVDYDSRLYEGLDPKRLMDLYGEWMKLLAQFVSMLNKKKMKKFTESLVEASLAYLLERYDGNDLRGFEEFGYWLELINIGK